ncbi:hypothetical protein [Streptomyces sp. RLB1-9]|uniref:hypothetical protein n=1 Tax=Streptomyces sp. RLB1-9 TaxID=2594454 RepID=UPI0013DA80CE|nr:hypothetical protein [Streptomyces sp. RLB1-9]
MSQQETTKPRPFVVGRMLFVRIPRVGLCHMGSWGWEPCPEGFLTTHQEIAERQVTG